MNLRPPSMIDVAKHSGVSHQTVSRVLNNSAGVSEKTRAKVLASINALGYTRNLAARALVTGKTFTIGVVSFDSGLYGPSSMLHAIQSAAKDAGYGVVLTSIRELNKKALAEAIDELTNVRVDGIAVIAPQSSALKEFQGLDVKLPIVAPQSPNRKMFPTFNIDQYAGSQKAVEHLISLGHKKIAHISGPADWFDASQRLQGWKDLLTEKSLSTKNLYLGDWTPQSGYEATKKIVKTRDITAIFAANDAMAIGALRALHELNIRVPEEMSVVGFDNTQESGMLIPGLTSVDQDFSRLGHELLSLLIQQITGEKASKKEFKLTPELIVRQSSGPASK